MTLFHAEVWPTLESLKPAQPILACHITVENSCVYCNVFYGISSFIQVERIVPGPLPPSIKEPVVLVVNKADGDEEVPLNNY